MRAQIEGGIIFGITAALYGQITLKNGRVEQSNFDNYRMLRINEVPVVEVHIIKSAEAPRRYRRTGHRGGLSGCHQCDFRCNRQAHPKVAG